MGYSELCSYFYLSHLHFIPGIKLPCSKESSTYDHRKWKTELPVRSAVLKPLAGRLVVGWVTTSESRLSYVFDDFFFFIWPFFLNSFMNGLRLYFPLLTVVDILSPLLPPGLASSTSSTRTSFASYTITRTQTRTRARTPTPRRIDGPLEGERVYVYVCNLYLVASVACGIFWYCSFGKASFGHISRLEHLL